MDAGHDDDCVETYVGSFRRSLLVRRRGERGVGQNDGSSARRGHVRTRKRLAGLGVVKVEQARSAAERLHPHGNHQWLTHGIEAGAARQGVRAEALALMPH